MASCNRVDSHLRKLLGQLPLVFGLLEMVSTVSEGHELAHGSRCSDQHSAEYPLYLSHGRPYGIGAIPLAVRFGFIESDRWSIGHRFAGFIVWRQARDSLAGQST